MSLKIGIDLLINFGEHSHMASDVLGIFDLTTYSSAPNKRVLMHVYFRQSLSLNIDIFFCSIPLKIKHILWGRMDGTQFL